MKKRKQSGFTLIELVIVIIILGIVGAGVSDLLVNSVTAASLGRDFIDADWQGRVGIERMTRDIRAIRSSSDISIANAGRFRFVDIAGESINYSVSNNRLRRNNRVLADGISSVTFQYFNANGQSTSTISAIRYIRVTLTVQLRSSTFDLVTAIYPWNLS